MLLEKLVSPGIGNRLVIFVTHRAPATVRGWVALERRRRSFAEVSRCHRSRQAPPPHPARRLTRWRLSVFPATICDGESTGDLAVKKEFYLESWLLAKAENGGEGTENEANEVEIESRGESFMPERFKSLTKETPDKPLRCILPTVVLC
nr:Embryo defective 1923 [Ipomoea batatas]